MENYKILGQYDQMSINVLKYLFKISKDIESLQEIVNIELGCTFVNRDDNFKRFINKYNKGKSYLFRTQGYIESLVINKAYINISICYLKKNLLEPTFYNFYEAINSFDKLRQYCKTKHTKTFKEFEKKILDLHDNLNTLKIQCNDYCVNYY